MKVTKGLQTVLAGLLAVAVCQAAWSQEEGAGPRPKGQFRQGGEGRPGLGPMGGPREVMPGMEIPAVREEMQRHAEAMRALLAGQRDTAQQINAEAKALREKGADQAAIDEALKKFAPQAEPVAAKLADELALHHENLAKIFKENREETIRQLALGILRRMASREPGQRLGGPGAGGERPFPKGKGGPPKAKEAPPENF